MTYLFKNNAASTLAATCAISDLNLTVAVGQGARFPSPGAGQSFLLTIQQGSSIEVVECTSRAGDVLTIERAREGTSAQTWNVGASVTLRVTETSLNTFVQLADGDARYAAINGPISLSADPVSGTQAARKSYVDGLVATLTAADIALDARLDELESRYLIGEVVDYAGLNLPAKFLWANGAAVSRTTYAALFAALTRELTYNVTAGSPTITVTAGDITDFLPLHAVVADPLDFAGGTTIVAVDEVAATITLSTNALRNRTGGAGSMTIGDVAVSFNATLGSPTITVTSAFPALIQQVPVTSTAVFASGTVVRGVDRSAGTLRLSNNAGSSQTGATLRLAPYGAGDNTTTFNVPNRRGRMALGRDGMGSGAVAGQVTPGTTGVAGVPGQRAGDQRLASHFHTGTTGNAGSHFHFTSIGWRQFQDGAGPGIQALDPFSAPSGGVNLNTSTTGDHTHAFTTNATGSGGSGNMPPFEVTNFIIYAGA